jgi:acyl dehydratase
MGLSGPFAGSIASGWHTASLFMRLSVDCYLSRVASLASPGSTNYDERRRFGREIH